MSNAPIELIISCASFLFTAYFWFVQARRERPQLKIYQVSGFRSSSHRNQHRDGVRRLCVQQLDSSGVLIANNSIRQNSIVFFECWLLLPDGSQIAGDWGAVGDDRLPWNIGPESSISVGLACFFDVPDDFKLPNHFDIGVEFITASGRRFSQTFTREMPPLQSGATEFLGAA